MRDFKYRQLLTGQGKVVAMMAPFNAIRSACLKECAHAFRLNLHRIALFARLPADIAYIARRETLWLANARRRAGEPELTLDDLGKQAFKPTQPMKTEVEKQAKQFVQDPKNEAKYFGSLGIEYTELLLKNLPATQDSMDALYSFIILESWSAFECLAARLWVAGVDHSPPEVAARLITAKAKIFDRAEDNLRIEQLYAIGINPKTHYGSFLKAIGRVSFQKLGKIHCFYEAAFGKKVSLLFQTTEGGYIYALAAFRNALVHAGAIADKDFTEQIERFPDFKHIKEKSPILLNGEEVRNLSNSVIALGGSLLKSVDDIVTPP